MQIMDIIARHVAGREMDVEGARGQTQDLDNLINGKVLK